MLYKALCFYNYYKITSKTILKVTNSTFDFPDKGLPKRPNDTLVLIGSKAQSNVSLYYVKEMVSLNRLLGRQINS